MIAKKLNKKDSRKLIVEGRLNGMTDQEIYFQLRQRSNDRQGIAKLIVTTALAESVEKFKYHRYFIIVFLLGISIWLTYLVIEATQFPDWPKTIILLVYSVMIFIYCRLLLNGYNLFEINQLAISPTIIFLLLSEIKISTFAFVVIGVLYILLTVFTLYITNKSAPEKFKWGWNVLKKDENNEYIV